MSSGDLLKQLFRKYKVGDDSGFETIAQQIIAQEREKNHHVLAADLQRILYNGNGAGIPSTNGHLKPLPRDQEDNSPLLEIREPEKYWPNVILSDKNRSRLERVILEIRRRESLETYGVRPSTRLLFCGPPGCGKTLTAEVIAGELGLPILYTRFDSIISSYLGQTSANLRKVFDYAASSSWVVFFDEFDAIGKSRDDQSEHGELKRVVNSFLQLLDSFPTDSIIIAATNHEGLLDRALWRRFDDIIFFDLPDRTQIPEIIQRKLNSFRHKSLCLDEKMIDQMIGFSYADIEQICFETIKEAVLNQKEQITNQEFANALAYHIDRQHIIRKTSL